ncbi:MAG: lactonase family protein [Acidobacteriota bacterium]|nr:lactonase family protein [Acidobacteriota bacterium]
MSRRSFVSLASAAVATVTLGSSSLVAEPQEAGTMVYIGTTDNTAGGDGVFVARWDAKAGALRNLRVAAPVHSAGFPALAQIGAERYLFAGHQLGEGKARLSSYRIAHGGDLELVNSIDTDHFDFVHTGIDHTHRALVTASYGSGRVASYHISPQGRLSGPVTQLQLEGHGPNASRQTSPHAHGVAIAPGNRFVLINDLGTDQIRVYKLDAATARLEPNDPPHFQAAPGSGPRHTAFHPNGKWAYSINEIDSTITQLAWDDAAGKLTLLDTVPTLPPGGDVANNRAGEVVFDRTAKYLYACNRGAVEELLTFAVGAGGKLTLAGRTPLGGKEARHFAVSPDNRFLVVARQFSNQVAVFARDAKTGLLTDTGAAVEVKVPSCVLFA